MIYIGLLILCIGLILEGPVYLPKKLWIIISGLSLIGVGAGFINNCANAAML